MSDVEEPPSKMSKYEEYLEDEEECLGEGQEEWLSDGVLTDDDYHIPSADRDKNESHLEHSMEEDHDTMMSNHELEALNETNGIQDTDLNIEDTLNNLDSKKEMSEDLNKFLIRKTDGKLLESTAKEEKVSNIKEDDDGNDTDDLLRLLEDNQQVKKKTIKMVKSEKTPEQDSTDDDEFIYERNKVKTLKVAKNALIKRIPSKAVPEHMSDSDDETDASSDEGATMKKIFGVKNAREHTDKKVGEQSKKVVKHVVEVNAVYNKLKSQSKTVPKQTPNKPKIETKSFKPLEVKTSTPFKSTGKSVTKTQKAVKLEKNIAKEKNIKEKTLDEKNIKMEEQDEIIDGEEFLEDENFDLGEEEFVEESEAEKAGLRETLKKQRIMKPEVMDEEVPSDEESHSEDGSLYDELPSSDSEDFDDWFTLDIRAERAADYLPLLGRFSGGCASALLSAERRRAARRVATLRESLSALTDSARRQADALRHAAMALAEIDDTLRAA